MTELRTSGLLRAESIRARLREIATLQKEVAVSLKGKSKADNQMREANKALRKRLRQDKLRLVEKYNTLRGNHDETP